MDSPWDVFAVLMVVLGGLGLVLRVPMIFSPAWAKFMLRWMLRHRVVLRVAMAVIAAIGASFIWAAPIIANRGGLDRSYWPFAVMFVLGILLMTAGLVFLVVPRIFLFFASYLKASSDLTIRIMATVGALAAAFIVLTGLMMLV